MKFVEDIKLEGVVNTNEDSKAVQRDLVGAGAGGGGNGEVGRSLAGNCYLGGQEGGCVGWAAPGATWRARGEEKPSPGLGWSWEQPPLAWVWVLGANLNWFSHL